MKKVLIVAYYFPPIATSGALRPLGFCRYLEQYGWLPRVLTTEPGSVYPPLGVDEKLGGQLLHTLQIDRVPHANPLQTLLHARHKLRGLARSLSAFESQRLHTSKSLLTEAQTGLHGKNFPLKDLILDWLFAFPDPQCLWLRPAIRRLWKLPHKERPDVVVATGGPWTGLLIGRALAHRFDVPFVADFRDPWASGNPYKRSLSTPLSRKAKKLERLICNAAARVVTNTEELRAQFLGNYPDYTHKIVTITNGFDSGAYEPFVKFYQDSTYARTFDPDKDVLELCHFGTVYGNRNPLALFQAMKELLQENRMQQGQLRVRLVGTWEVRDDRCEALARELETQGFLQREPQVPYELCLQRMTSAPILLILQPASPLQVPAKIYEYIATGRPLLVIGGEGATARLVEQYQLGRCCPNHVPAIKTLLWHLITGQTRIEPPQTVSRAHFDYYTLTGELAHLLDSVCAEKQRALQ